jgi:hypothetical protein
VVAALLLAAGCSSPSAPDESAGSGSATRSTGTATDPSPTATAGEPTPTAPPADATELAGPSEAAAAASLAAGPAAGTVVITYDGLGEADSPFTGTCTRSGAATTVSGTAGTATVDLAFDPSAVTLTVQDTGLGTAVTQVGTADLTVSEDRLVLSAALIQQDQRVGSVRIDVTCGG